MQQKIEPTNKILSGSQPNIQFFSFDKFPPPKKKKITRWVQELKTE